MKKTLWRVSALALLAAGGLAHAQSTPATPSASSTPSTPAKKELVAKMVQLQQPASENL
ncbi:MAG: hypothetical protein JWP29_3927, partial [Rhodoferax sp.]|nr:hypothetical protein [Rhodoferax sp.]